MRGVRMAGLVWIAFAVGCVSYVDYAVTPSDIRLRIVQAEADPAEWTIVVEGPVMRGQRLEVRADEDGRVAFTFPGFRSGYAVRFGFVLEGTKPADERVIHIRHAGADQRILSLADINALALDAARWRVLDLDD